MGKRKGKIEHSFRQCEAELVFVMPGHAQSPDGTVFNCSCGDRWVHVCDEAEGCYWALRTKAKS